MVALLALGTGVDWSAGGGMETVRPPSTDSIQLDVDPLYWIDGPTLLPGLAPGAPLTEVDPVPVDSRLRRVLVYMEPTLQRGSTERVEVKVFTAEVGGFVKYEYPTVMPDVLNLRDLTDADVEALKTMPGVVKVEEDEYHANVLMLHDSMPLIRGLQSQITGAGYSADGSGVRICIVDTGIDSDHVMYSSRIDTSKGYDFYNDDSDPEDDNGHGSHCSGIAAGGTGLSWDPCATGAMPFQGVAPEATLIGVKVLNASGGGYDSDIIAGINYCADQSASGAQADVISMSIGTGNYSGLCTHSWAVAANNAVANGVVAIAASGNENNSNSMGSPACGVNVIAVGMTWKNDYPTCEDATTDWSWGICTDYAPQTDEIGCFSNESDYLDVAAPGANIWSASNAAGGGSIAGSSGTSMSCPTVAGLAALVLGMDGSLTPAEVRQMIRDGAIDMGPAGFDRAYGYGRIDVLNTLALVTTGPTCSDGILNQGEDRIDCGGPCPACACTSDAACSDGAWCTGTETCDAYGDCQAGTAPNCNDGVSCTDDSCNEGTDSCDNIANDAHCVNGLYCDGDEWCHATADCQSGTAPDCSDGVGCTDDSCNEGTDSCDNIANDSNCDNGLWCDGAETCHATLDCQSGTAPNCNDGVGCTDDSCNEGTDSCDNIANDANCDNGLFCDGAETCHATLDCQAGSDPCVGFFGCDEANDVCVECFVDGDCDDGVGCTDDTCTGINTCDYAPNDSLCDNGLYCDGVETCHATLDCQSGTAPTCNDGVGCTDDSCNEGTDSCDNIANDANCPDDGLFCNGTEFCDAVSDCDHTGDPCAPDFCNETTDTCETAECQVPADCDDGSDCTVDDCVDGVCYNDCAGTISTFPYSEDFEAGLGAWTNATGDIFDWTRNSGGTPSSDTGPSGDHTTGSGWYMYIETSSPRVQGDTAILESPCVDLTGKGEADLTFWYHMYGASVGTLDVEVTDDCSTWTNVWTLSGNQGNSWYQATVNLDAYTGSIVKVRFIGTRGSSWDADIAIDDIGLTAVSATPCTGDPECDDSDACTVDSCVDNLCQNIQISCDDGNDCTVDSCSGGVCINECPAHVASFPYTEGFESGWGDWANVGGDAMDWTWNSGSTPSSNTGPTGAHGGSYYVYTESSSPNYPNVTGIIEGPCLDFTAASAAEMTFWYHMYGAAMGTLYAEVSEDCVSWTTVWSLFGDQGNTWYQATVDLSVYDGTVITVRFRGVTGSSYTSDICVDDLEVTASSGPECTIPDDCDDGLWCNGAEDCVAGSCVDGTAPNCNDGVDCTDDSCNEGTDSCDNVTNDANCDNGLWCDGAETCHATLDCQAGTAPNCDDGVGCTDDSCNEGTDSCDNAPNHAACADGVFCNGAEICNAVTDCGAGSDPCPGQYCDEGSDSCYDCETDPECDDGLFCNGAETCVGGFCQAGTDPCPGQYCNETTDACETAECQVPADCDDASDCTVDTCVDGVCYNDCPTEVSSFPYTEGFEGGFGDWANVGGDDMDWTRQSGSTPSSNTGPSSAHGGSYYVYTESSSPNYPNRTAILEGPCFDLTNATDADLTFWYHMYGTAMGTLNLEVSEDCVSWTTVWSLFGNQGNAWYEANVDLSAYAYTKIKMRFRGVTGSSYTSDMSVDDLSMTATIAAPCDYPSDCDDGLFCNGAEDCVDSTCTAGSDPCPGQSCDEVNDTCVAGPALQYSWNMDTNPGWTTQGLWAWGQPTGGGGQYGGPDPTSGYTGSNVFGYNLSGDYENGLSETHLTTTAIDCTGLTDVTLEFRRWLGVERSTYDHAYIRVSNNGTSWTTIWQNPDSQIEDSSWTLQDFDISSVADGQSTVYVRWTMGTTDGSWQFCGWNIDDV